MGLCAWWMQEELTSGASGYRPAVTARCPGGRLHPSDPPRAGPTVKGCVLHTSLLLLAPSAGFQDFPGVLGICCVSLAAGCECGDLLQAQREQLPCIIPTCAALICTAHTAQKMIV